MKNNLIIIHQNRHIKYEDIVVYLSQDNGYWLENDLWDLEKSIFLGKKLKGSKHLNFDYIDKEIIKNEMKYYLLYSFKNEIISDNSLIRKSPAIKILYRFIKKYYPRASSLKNIEFTKTTIIRLKSYILEGELSEETANTYASYCKNVINFINDIYDDRDETEKDIWYAVNIKGAKISASQKSSSTGVCLNFTYIPIYYRNTVKKFMKTIITKKSWSHCFQFLKHLNYFFNSFYKNGYSDGFLENISRGDIECYLFWVNTYFKGYHKTYKSKFVSYIRVFLEYIQMAQYEKSPIKHTSFLIFPDDIPKKQLINEEVKNARFVPEPILRQLDNNIMELDRPIYIPVYILLRETGWRSTDILNIRYNNCLEQVWNESEKKYNYYLCGEITKTDIPKLKIPIRDGVAEIIKKEIEKTKTQSSEDNNPNKYLFNVYKGKNKGNPYSKQTIVNSVDRLIVKKDIRNPDGTLFKFRPHDLRHTRAKEFVEQGIGISIIQQMLGHSSLKMTVHYATVSENVLYEKWKSTEELDLFKVNTNTNELEPVRIDSNEGDDIVRYEYIKKNLDAVRVPFGVCFKPSKLPCKQQINHCLTCASFCTTVENIPEYEEEIEKVRHQIEISNRFGREVWAEKNKQYLDVLEQTLEKVKAHKLVHKNGKSREDII